MFCLDDERCFARGIFNAFCGSDFTVVIPDRKDLVGFRAYSKRLDIGLIPNEGFAIKIDDTVICFPEPKMDVEKVEMAFEDEYNRRLKGKYNLEKEEKEKEKIYKFTCKYWR